MDAKTDLARHFFMMVHSKVQPTFQDILDVLQDYKTEYSSGLEQVDFNRQIICFIGAKRSEGISPKTAANYQLYLRMFGSHIDKRPNEIITNDIRDFIMYLTEVRKLHVNSVQSVINILRSFFGWLFLEELIPKNPMLRIKSFKINKKDSRHALSLVELEKLRNACCTYREKALVEFLYSTGCRLDEMIRLNCYDLNMEGRSVEVLGKGNKFRTIYFSVRACLMLQEYQKERKGGDALFCSSRQPYDRLKARAIEQLLHKLGQRAGISRRVYPHILRHTMATHLLNAGCDLTIIQRLLGHTSVGTTEIYAQLTHENVHREYERYIA